MQYDNNSHIAFYFKRQVISNEWQLERDLNFYIFYDKMINMYAVIVN